MRCAICDFIEGEAGSLYYGSLAAGMPDNKVRLREGTPVCDDCWEESSVIFGDEDELMDLTVSEEELYQEEMMEDARQEYEPRE